MKRPTIYALEDRLRQLRVPTLVLIGDEDEPCIEPAIFMKRHIPRAGLAVFPQSGHTINLEEPDRFNRSVLDFLTAVEAERWPERAP
jgi:proline iminopeptidase